MTLTLAPTRFCYLLPGGRQTGGGLQDTVMKKLSCLVLVVLLLSACSAPDSQPTEPPPTEPVDRPQPVADRRSTSTSARQTRSPRTVLSNTTSVSGTTAAPTQKAWSLRSRCPFRSPKSRQNAARASRKKSRRGDFTEGAIAQGRLRPSSRRNFSEQSFVPAGVLAPLKVSIFLPVRAELNQTNPDDRAKTSLFGGLGKLDIFLGKSVPADVLSKFPPVRG